MAKKLTPGHQGLIGGSPFYFVRDDRLSEFELDVSRVKALVGAS